MPKNKINPKDLDLHPLYAHLDLWYNVRDYETCQQVRFYRRAKINSHGHRKGEFYEIPVYIIDKTANRQKRGLMLNAKPNLRRRIKISHKGKPVNLYCAHLVVKIGWTFPIEDPHHNVIDHISHDSLDDRRNNLQLWSQSENVRTAACNEARRINGKRSGALLKGIPTAKRRELAAYRRQLLAMTGHMPSLEDAMRDLGLEKGGAE